MQITLRKNEIPPHLAKFFKLTITQVKQGNVLLEPFRLALALQADGWLVRNDCVWQKVSPMPESVSGTHWERHKVKVAPRPILGKTKASTTGEIPGRDTPGSVHKTTGRLSDPAGNAQWTDCPGCPACETTDGYVLRRGSWRHTRSHEFIFMLTKQMGYFANQEAVREAGAEPNRQRGDAIGTIQRRLAGRPVDRVAVATTARNPRSVLTPKPESYQGQHYAVYPRDLIGPLLRATCPSRCCPVCGAGHAPVVEKPDMRQRPTRSNAAKYPTNGMEYSDDGGGTLKSAGQAYQEWRDDNPDVVLGYRPTCACTRALAVEYTADSPQPVEEWARRLVESAERLSPVPGLVLDPFVGSGTTAMVAKELGLRCVGLDLSGEYLSQQAAVRVLNRTPAGAMEDLPLFAAGEYADA